jgi:transposase InsO family protein
VKSVKLPPRSPNLNAHAERFVQSIKESCLERMIFFGEGSLRRAIHEYVAHYHGERNHQGLDNRIINPDSEHFELLLPNRCLRLAHAGCVGQGVVGPVVDTLRTPKRDLNCRKAAVPEV